MERCLRCFADSQFSRPRSAVGLRGPEKTSDQHGRSAKGEHCQHCLLVLHGDDVLTKLVGNLLCFQDIFSLGFAVQVSRFAVLVLLCKDVDLLHSGADLVWAQGPGKACELKASHPWSNYF